MEMFCSRHTFLLWPYGLVCWSIWKSPITLYLVMYDNNRVVIAYMVADDKKTIAEQSS